VKEIKNKNLKNAIFKHVLFGLLGVIGANAQKHAVQELRQVCEHVPFKTLVLEMQQNNKIATNRNALRAKVPTLLFAVRIPVASRIVMVLLRANVSLVS